MLKIDSQGAELKVLGGAEEMLIPATIRALFCEVSVISVYERQAFFGDVYQLLTSRGYRLVDLYNEARDEGGRLMWCDALFT